MTNFKFCVPRGAIKLSLGRAAVYKKVAHQKHNQPKAIWPKITKTNPRFILLLNTVHTITPAIELPTDVVGKLNAPASATNHRILFKERHSYSKHNRLWSWTATG